MSAPETPEPSVPARSPDGLLSVLRQAVAGVHPAHDFTQGPLGRAILLLSIPMVLEMVMESLFAIVDVYFVSRLGADAIATVGLTESMLALVYAVAMGLSIGATAVVARRIGEGDPERAAQAAAQALVLGVLVAVPVGLVGALAARPLLSVMGASPWVLAHGVGFTRVMLGSTPIIVLLFLINAVFRAAGDAAISMRVLWLANACNIVLGPCLVFGVGPLPELGVLGAAVGTALGRSIGVAYQLYRLTRGDGRIALARRHLRLEAATMLTMLRLSASATFQMLVGTASWLGMVRIMAGFGSAAVAGYTLAMRIVMFALLPSWGMSNAAATLTGQSLGAGRPERAEAAVWRAGRYNMLFLGGVSVLFLAFAPALLAAFTHEPEVHGHAVHGLRIVSAGFVFYAYGMVLTQAFNGAGDTATPTLLNLVCFWLLELPLAYVLAYPAGLGPTGGFLAITTAFVVLTLASALLFRRGKWKLRAL